MILSRSRAYLFLHAPKTGGTSMALALEARAMKDDIMLGDTPKAKKRRRRLKDVQTRGRLWKHSTLADLEGLVQADELERLFIFTMVRNPWDRVVSYYHWLRAQSFAHPAVDWAKSMEFADFATHEGVLASLQASSARSYVTDTGGVDRAGAYIRLEHFEADAAPLWDHLGFELEFPHANASQRATDYRSYYSDKSRAAIAAACAEDIGRFGYFFD